MQNQKIFELQELERKILTGLSAEWECAVSALPPRWRELMRPPIFSIDDMKQNWGLWRPDVREIALSRRLVMEHPWHSVREVLHHEMAHQLASEALGLSSESPHGPAFRQACRLLNANPRASGNFPLLDQRIGSDSADPNDRIMLRVQKLLALAESSNPHESRAAMAAAHRLVEKYNIELIEKKAKQNYVSVFLGQCAARHPKEHKFLCLLVQDFYFVKNIWISSWTVEKGSMGRVAEISGTPQNVQIASYVYDCVNQYIKSQWSKYRQRNASVSGRSRSDFAVGVIEGFRSTLEKQRQTNVHSASRKNLICLEDPQLVEYVKNRYPIVRKRSKRYSMKNQRIRLDGQNAGKRLVISKAVSTTGPAGGILPG